MTNFPIITKYLTTKLAWRARGMVAATDALTSESNYVLNMDEDLIGVFMEEVESIDLTDWAESFPIISRIIVSMASHYRGLYIDEAEYQELTGEEAMSLLETLFGEQHDEDEDE